MSLTSSFDLKFILGLKRLVSETCDSLSSECGYINFVPEFPDLTLFSH